jgi:prepilin-type N-terminal cleavage/methylation domain-containing protein
MKKAFTLLETLIVLVIIGILAVALTQAYLTITKVAFKIEQEKNLSEESLMLTQILQSITETATIDYEKYTDLASTQGFVDTLYLTGEQWTGVSIFSSGSCLSLEGVEFQPNADGSYDDPSVQLIENSGCQLILSREGGTTSLLSATLIPSKVQFKIIPFDSEVKYFSDAYADKILLNAIAKP